MSDPQWDSPQQIAKNFLWDSDAGQWVPHGVSTGTGSEVQVTNGSLDVHNYVWDVDTLAWVVQSASSGVGSDVNVTGSVLPTGAATGAKQDTGNTALAAIKTAVEGLEAAPLTDAQLRTTAVPVSLASVPSHAVTNAGTFAVQAAQSGTWTVQPGNTANTTAWKVDGSAVTQPVSGTFWQATQPVSGTVAVSGTVTVDTELTTADLDTGAGTDTRAVVGLVGSKSGGGVLIPGDATAGLKVDLGADNDVTITSGTVTTITNVVHVDDNSGSVTVDAPVATPVFVRLSDGAAAITTLPVSIATAPVLVAGSAIIGKVGIDQTTPGTTNAVAATNLPTTVDTNSGNKSASTLRVVLATDQPTNSNALAVSLASVPSHAVTNAGTFAVQANSSLETSTIYNGTTALTPKFAKIAASTSGDNTIVAAVTSKKIRVLAYNFISNGTVNAKFQSGAAGTDLTGLKYCVANSGICAPFNPAGWFESASGVLLNLNLSGNVAVGGELTYIEV